MERQDVEAMLDVLADNHNEEWDYLREDNIYIFIHNKKFKHSPHIRIRKDNGMLECLNGINFHKDGHNTKMWRMTCDEFVRIVTGKGVGSEL